MDLYDEGRLFVDNQVDWNVIKTEYVTDSSVSYRSLAEKYGVNQRTLERRAKSEEWVELRRQFACRVSENTLDLEAKKRARQSVAVGRIADKLLKKLSKAVDELDIEIARDVRKIKVIEYNNDKRPDKPTKETVDEIEEIRQIHTIVDRNGLKAIASALVDVQKALGIKTELDVREQMAKINALEAKSGIIGGDEDDEGGVILLSDVDEQPEEVSDGE